MTDKAFLSSGETQKTLSLGYRGRMQRLFHLLPHIYFEVRQTRFFPASYINRLAGYLDGSTDLERIESFTASDEARQLFRQAQSRFKTVCGSKPEHSPSEVADMLNVGRSTVSGWLLSGSLPYRTVPSRDNTPDRQFITSEALNQVFQWRHPFG